MVWLLILFIAFCIVMGFVIVLACIQSARMTEQNASQDVSTRPV